MCSVLSCSWGVPASRSWSRSKLQVSVMRAPLPSSFPEAMSEPFAVEKPIYGAEASMQQMAVGFDGRQHLLARKTGRGLFASRFAVMGTQLDTEPIFIAPPLLVAPLGEIQGQLIVTGRAGAVASMSRGLAPPTTKMVCSFTPLFKRCLWEPMGRPACPGQSTSSAVALVCRRRVVSSLSSAPSFKCFARSTPSTVRASHSRRA